MIYETLKALRDKGYTVQIEPHGGSMWKVTLTNEQEGELVSDIYKTVFSTLTCAMAKLQDPKLKDFAGDLGRKRGEVQSEAKSRANVENGRAGAIQRWAKK